MKVWWCEEHLCGNLPNQDTADWPSPPGQGDVCLWAEEFGSETKCRMVGMQLVLADARIVWICGGNGEWLEYTDEEWIEVFGEVPTDRCLLCGRTLEHMGCGFYNVFPTKASEPPPKDPWDYDP